MVFTTIIWTIAGCNGVLQENCQNTDGRISACNDTFWTDGIKDVSLISFKSFLIIIMSAVFCLYAFE